MIQRNIVLSRIRDRDSSSSLSRDLLSATKHARVENALRDILERLIANDMFAELEVGCDGRGPVVRAYEALEKELPPELVAYLDDDDEPPIDTTGRPVRCTVCGWLGESTELGKEGECGGEGCPGTAVSEITDPADLIHAWWDTDGQIGGPQLIEAGLIEPHPATEKEADELDIEVGDGVWGLSGAGEAALRSRQRGEQP